MKRFKRILLVVDRPNPSRSTLARTVNLARRNGASLTLFEVLSPTTSLKNLDACSAELSTADDFYGCADSEEISLAGIDFRVHMGTGDVWSETIREVLAGSHDLVVKSIPPDGCLGVTEENLMRRCPCPVWILKGCQDPFSSILAAVDLEGDDHNRVALNRTILELASSLAALEGARLHVVHAWSLFGEETYRGPRINLPRRQLAQLLRQTREEKQVNLDALLASVSFSGVEPEVDLRKGNPAEVIATVAGEAHADLIVMGTVSRTGIAAFLFENMSEIVTERVECSVLTVRPWGSTGAEERESHDS